MCVVVALLLSSIACRQHAAAHDIRGCVQVTRVHPSHDTTTHARTPLALTLLFASAAAFSAAATRSRMDAISA
jgi:hypothetical protein